MMSPVPSTHCQQTFSGSDTDVHCLPEGTVRWYQLPFFKRLTSVVLLLISWQLAVAVFTPALLPAPSEVFIRLAEEWQGTMPLHLSQTLIRVAIAFSAAMILGTALGLAMGHNRKVDAWTDSLLTLMLNVPALVTIILCFIWFGLNETAAIIAVILNKAPNVAVTLREGARAIDPKLMDVARVYRLGRVRTFRKVYLPQITPYLIAAARGGLALVWKIVLVVELIGCSDGVGFQLSSYFQLFDITAILAYTLAFVTVVYGIEALVLRPLENRLSGWRKS
ncbi:ABC transporter permease [Alteromonas sp. RKMC-009]|uniref:ABC transporter permease n=1 Tax=Alteromonas sp. RKMC-009 TaxID=2267264 RepID=UPI001E334A9A|nr:ABC transporter permease [Alteromonas sp. RKMC-009]